MNAKTNTKASTAAASTKVAPEVITTVKAETKADKARAIFAQCYGQSPVPQRKDILERVIKEADLTPAGAATYLQNYKRKEGLSKAPIAAGTPATA